MRPAVFQFARAETIAEAVAARQAGATFLAGGQALLASMKLRTAAPTAVIDIGALEALRTVDPLPDGGIRIGALATAAEIGRSPIIKAAYPWLTQAAAALGDVQIRNRATIGGNVAWADPRANFLIALAASRAIAIIDAGRGEVRIQVEAIATGFRQSDLGEGLLLSFELPDPTGHLGAYFELSRQPQDLAVVNVAIVLRGDPVKEASIVFGGLGNTPLRAHVLEQAVVGIAVDRLAEADLTVAARSFAVAPRADQHGPVEYRRDMAVVALRKAFRRLDQAKPF